MIDELASTFPDFGTFTSGDLDRTGKRLRLAGLRAGAGNYLSFSLSLSILVLLISALFLLTFLELLLALGFSLIWFAIVYFLTLRLPSILARRRGVGIESDLPVALRSMATELSMGVSFEKCLAHTAESEHRIAPELKRVLLEVNGGASPPEALRGMAEGIDSLALKRAAQQMIEAYKHGSRGEGLRHLAEEMIEVQKANARQYNAKIAFLGLMFVAVSCIVPALFEAYVVVGSSFLYSAFSPADIWLAYLVGFPAAGGVILLLIHEGTPRALWGRKEMLVSEKQIRLANRALRARGIGFDFKKSVAWSLGISTLLALALLVASLAFSFAPWVALLPFAFPFLAYFLVIRMVETRTAELEARLPDALLQASSFPKGTPTEKIIKSIADAGYGPLSEEFGSASRQISSGADVPSALKSVSDDNDSALLSRACGLLSRAYSAGGDMHRAMKETAEDMFAVFSIVRERESGLAIQKYTLIFGGALLVPLVLGTITNMVSKLGTSGIEFISSTTPAERAMLMGASVGAAQAYLVIYSLLASLFIAKLGGSWRNFALYFVMMAPVSLLAYNVAMGIDLMTIV